MINLGFNAVFKEDAQIDPTAVILSLHAAGNFRRDDFLNGYRE